MRTKYVWLGLFILGCLPAIGLRAEHAPQNTANGRPDALSFLDGVLKRYETAKTYHIVCGGVADQLRVKPTLGCVSSA